MILWNKLKLECPCPFSSLELEEMNRRVGEPGCRGKSKETGYLCTRAEGHEGPHAAGIGPLHLGGVILIWTDEEANG